MNDMKVLEVSLAFFAFCAHALKEFPFLGTARKVIQARAEDGRRYIVPIYDQVPGYRDPAKSFRAEEIFLNHVIKCNFMPGTPHVGLHIIVFGYGPETDTVYYYYEKEPPMFCELYHGEWVARTELW